MAHAVFTPRLNNNDDQVRLTDVLVRPGERIAVGQALAAIETDKAIVEVESDREGFALRVVHEVGSMVAVGSVLLWIGDAPDDAIPETTAPAQVQEIKTAAAEPTAKARALIAQHGLDAAAIPAHGDRLTAEDVEAFLKSNPPGHAAEPEQRRETSVPKALEVTVSSEAKKSSAPLAPGRLTPLSMEDRGMLRSVLWHRDEAVPAYLELEFDQEPWQEHAKAFAAQRRMLGDPLLPLLAQRLAAIAARHPKLNSTIVDGSRYAYEHVNLGFTIQVQESLYLVVVREAEAMEPHTFVETLNRLHKRAIARKLTPDELQGATVGFSSMARWQVSRHVPILPPHVSLMVAHTVSKNGQAVLGASYDHRVLSGGDTAAILERLSAPSQ